MSSYVNLNNISVEVSDKHIETSIEIYEELKKKSPSGRVSWKVHKKMMEQAGFFDSEVSENYRCLIKRARAEYGTLPSLDKHANMIADNKIVSIKKAIGEIRETQLEAQNDFNSLNRLKREWTRELVLAETIDKAIDRLDFSSFGDLDYVPVAKDGRAVKSALVFLSDIHYGYVGKNFLNEYSPEIARHLIINVYAEKLIELFKKENVEKIHVVNLGDLVEGVLRNQSLFDTQKSLSEQAVDATDIIIQFLMKLSKHVKVQYSGIAGNHDRLNPNAKDNIVGDSVVFVSNAIIERVANHIDAFDYVPLQDEYFGVISMGGKNIMVCHGDRTSVFKESVLAEQSQMIGIELDILVAGHYHKHFVKEVSGDKYVAIFGSIKGVDDYSIKIGKTSSRSQGVILFSPDESFEIKQIKL